MTTPLRDSKNESDESCFFFLRFFALFVFPLPLADFSDPLAGLAEEVAGDPLAGLRDDELGSPDEWDFFAEERGADGAGSDGVAIGRIGLVLLALYLHEDAVDPHEP